MPAATLPSLPAHTHTRARQKKLSTSFAPSFNLYVYLSPLDLKSVLQVIRETDLEILDDHDGSRNNTGQKAETGVEKSEESVSSAPLFSPRVAKNFHL